MKYKGYIIEKSKLGIYLVYKHKQDALLGRHAIGGKNTIAEAKKYIDSIEANQ